MYHWFIEYYGTGGFLHKVWIDADTKQNALRKLREKVRVIEVYCCRHVE